MRQGRLSFRTWSLWCGTIGPVREAAPLVFVPGGPGMPHVSFAPLAERAPPARALVFYDPTGAGGSDRPLGVTWDLDLFVDELEALRVALGLDRFHLFGSSFGGLVCLAYALRRPPGLASMTLAGASASYPETRAAVRRAILRLPPAARDPLLAETPGRWGPQVASTDYARAYQEYATRFLCRTRFPASLANALRQANTEAMLTLRGRGLMYDGTLRDVDLAPRLGAIDVPTLLTYGRHDPLYPEVADGLARALRRSRLAVFEHSSHMPQFEEEPEYARLLYGFLDEVDGRRD
jgi:proline-specific peptidase